MSKLKSVSSGKSGQSTDGSYSFVQDENLHKYSCSSLESVPGAKWLLDRHGIGKCYATDKLNLLDCDEVKKIDPSLYNTNAKASEENYLIEEFYTCHSQKDTTFCSKSQLEQLYSQAKSDQDSLFLEFESATDDDLQKAPMRKKIENLWLSNANLMDLDFEQSKKLCSDLDSQFIGLKNIKPWWHAADTCDLKSLASQMPSQFARNCDLPSVSVDKSMSKTSGLMESLLQGSDRTLRSSDGSCVMKLDTLDTNVSVCGDLSRSELLEALCHSQTRAREAEKMAQEACDEKEHVTNLFFQQASYLFAYRQWLQMLQLETLCLQLRTINQFSSFSPPFSKKNRRRFVKKRHGKPRGHLSKHAVAFAVGLTLAGAGLLVGLTIGWLFPAL